MNGAPSIGQYLIDRLASHGVGHVFGIPGDYVLGFYDLLVESPLEIVTTCDEQGAGFAADGYARLRGMGAVCITYCVGGLKVANAVAGAYAEKSPVVVISGAPGVKEREKNPLLHHKVREFDTQKHVFDQITVASTVLSDPQTAFQEIDRVLHMATRYKRPVYIEVPRDMVTRPGLAHHKPSVLQEQSDPAALQEALVEATAMINRAKKPVILADVEVHRFGLQEDLLKLLKTCNIPFATTILGKSVVGEQHPLFLGIYEGAMGRESVREYVESSDCVLMLGAFLTDINLGIYTARLDPSRSIYATSERLAIRYHSFENVLFEDFMQGLARCRLKRRAAPKIARPDLPALPSRDGARIHRSKPLSVAKMFEMLNHFLADNTIVVADVGDSLFGAADLFIHQRSEFLGPAYYASMGFAVPAALGAELANPLLRPLVIVGDGAFQMTGMELSTVVRQRLRPIVLVLNNRGYGTERHIHDGPYNDILTWNYHRVPEVLGEGRSWVAASELQFETALREAAQNLESYSLIEVQLPQMDRSPALDRLAKRLAQNV